MNYLDVLRESNIRNWYLKIIEMDSQRLKHSNKNVERAIRKDKIRIFKIIIDLKKKNGLDYTDDESRILQLKNENK